MLVRTQLDEARRWTKFPATVLFITGLLWLIVVVSRVAQDWDAYVAQPSETFIGAIGVLLKIPVVLLGCPLAAIGMLFLQRPALYTGAVLPFIPLVFLTLDKAQRIGVKFHEYRSLGRVGSFGDAVLEALILVGLWVVCGLHIDSIRRALRELGKAEQWTGGAARSTPAASPARVASTAAAANAASPADNVDGSMEEECFLLPETETLDED